MAIQKWLLFLFLHIRLHCLILAQPPSLDYSACGGNGNYTENSTYKNNLNSLLSSLSSRIDKYGFYNASIGQNSDRASVVVLCRGDVEIEECRSCVDNVTQKLVQSCPNQKEGFGLYEKCSLRYSNQSIIGRTSFSLLAYLWNKENASNPVEFNQDLRKLLESLKDAAANGGPFRKYASGNATGPDFRTIYALVQCTPDLSPQNCFDCLTQAYGDMPNCPCNGERGGRIIGARCSFRYETNSRFFEDVQLEAPPPSVPTEDDDKTAPTGKDDKTSRTVIIIVVPIVITVILIGCISVILMRRRKRKLVDESQSIRGDDISTIESLQYDFSTLRAATDNFSNANKLGQGGFGPVYKGKLPNGQEVAVKRLAANSGQGDVEFRNEVLLVARLQHRNLVRLLGFCLDGTERLLIYEFVPNASLDRFLFDPGKHMHLDWERRSKIIGGVARGLLYLHEDSRLRIVHRDLKAGNVLLDAEMNPKISDFGLARLFAMDESQNNTSKIAGTSGYMAPESIQGKISVKSDVFSFGVLVLEILGGQRNTCFRNGEYEGNFLSYAWTNWRKGTTTNLIDPMLRGRTRESAITRYIHIALLCVQENDVDRPTMTEVVLMLSSLSLNLSVPSSPAYFIQTDVSPKISSI